MFRFLRLCFVCFALLIFVLPSFARQEVSLNGTWQMAKVTSLDAAPPATGWADFEVPGTLGGWKYERAWFRRTLLVPENWRGQRVKLRFGGVRWNSQIFVNESKFKGPLNGFDAFELDITDAVKIGGANILRIGVEDWTATFAPGDPVDFSKVNDSFAARGVPKNRVISPFGGHNGNYGIWDDVTLSAVPPAHVAHAFITPSLRRKVLEVRFGLSSAGRSLPAVPQVRLLEYQGAPRDASGQWPAGKVLATFPPPNAPQTLNEVSYTTRLDNPKLEEWSPQNPRLYVLEIKIGDDVWRERFGWRELHTQNGDFILNGKKTHLLATSWWPNAQKPLDHATVAAQLKAIRAANTFTFRTHTQPWPRRWYELADEIGVMMIPEGAMWCDSKVYAVNDERFWANYSLHLARMARTLYNHASVVMYSLENEMGHCGGKDNPAMEAGFARMARVIKAADPTRPITFEADGDPGGQADVIGIHYPNEYPQKRLWPNDGYWLHEPRKLSLFGPQPFLWKKDKPIYIGEYLWVYQNSSPAAHTLFFGDEAYRDHKTYSARAKGEAWRMQIQAYRAQDVSGHSPWTMHENGPLDARNPTWGAHQSMFRPLAAFIKEYDSRFWAGETVTRTVQIVNDTLKDEPSLRLTWTLKEIPKFIAAEHQEIPVKSGAQTVNIKAGGILEVPIQIPLPAVKSPTQFLLYLELSSSNKGWFQESWSIRAYPRAQKWNLPATNIALFDPQGTLRKSWQQSAVAFKTLTKLDDWDGKGVLVIGPAPAGKKIETGVSVADLQPLAQQNANGNQAAELQIIGGASGGQQLAEKVRAGGRVLVLEQNPADWLPARLTEQGSTMSFAHLPKHPVLQRDFQINAPNEAEQLFTRQLLNIDSRSLRWWRGDHMVSRNEPLREAQAGVKPIIVTGGEQGVSHAPLLEINHGAGAWLICQMQVASKIDREPTARRLLENALQYLNTYQAPQGDIAFFGSDALGKKLTRLGVEYLALRSWDALQFPQIRALILQSDGATVAQNAEKIKLFMEAGGQVLWHRPQADNFADATRALNIKLDRVAYSGPALRADAMPDGWEFLTREDLYWLGTNTGVAWNAAPLAPSAEAYFGETPKEIQGEKHEAENAPQLEGQLVRVDGNEVGFFTSGSATWKIKIPADSRYTISVYARGSAFQNVFPQIALTLNGQPIGTVNLTDKNTRFYNVDFAAKAGERELKAAFVNDQGGDGEDRNLWIDRFIIGAQTEISPIQNLTTPAALVRYPIGKGALVFSAIQWDEAGGNQGKANRFAASLFTALGARNAGPSKGSRIEPEKMASQPNLNWYRRESDHVYMGSAGYIEGPVRVEKAGRYRVDVWGKGSKGAGIYPIIVLEFDGKEIGRGEIKSDDWAPHSLTVNLPADVKPLRIRFINDDAPAPEDRNLWIERLEFEQVE